MSMFGQKEFEDSGHQMSALLEPGCEFDGKLTFQGTVRINGHYMGEIFSEGTLVVGEGALVEARIEVGSIIINGKVNGEIIAEDRIEMKSSAEVRGNVTAKTLVIEEGVLFEGNCRMGDQAAISHGDERVTTLLSGNGNEVGDEVPEGITSL